MEELKLPIQLSKVDPTLLVSITMFKGIGSKPDVAELTWRGVILCHIYPDGTQTAEQRAQKVVQGFNALIDASLQPYEVHASRDGTKVLARSVVVLTESDAAAQDKTIAVLAKEVAGRRDAGLPSADNSTTHSKSQVTKPARNINKW